MYNIKVGDELKIECYKHNGFLDRISSEATVLEITDDYLVVANDHTKLTDHFGRSHRTNEPAILFFYKKNWFNIIAQFKNHGLFYYCNIASPFTIDGRTIKYIDYDLDLRVFPDGGFRILDRNEYKYHKKIMNYSKEIDSIVRCELTNLINQKRMNSWPFQKEIVEKYYDLFRKIQKNKKN